MQVKRWWKLLDAPHTETFEQTAEHVRFLVTDAIERQLVSDVPIGTFLSGGLDSSLISALAAGHCRDRGILLQTFSVTYQGNDRYFKQAGFTRQRRYVHRQNGGRHSKRASYYCT